MYWYTENDIKTLLSDPDASKALGDAFLQVHRMLNKLGMEEGIWGPAQETGSQVRRKLQVHFDRISEEKRSK